MLFEFMYMGK